MPDEHLISFPHLFIGNVALLSQHWVEGKERGEGKDEGEGKREREGEGEKERGESRLGVSWRD
jgi:hypothetical protein